jgi:putative hydrolase of the HAD superfamily
MGKKYSHLFFDLDNTIWDFDSNSFDALQAALKKMDLLDKIGSYGDFYNIFDSVNENLWALYREGKISKRILRVQRFEESFEKNGSLFPGMAELVNDAYLAEMPGLTRLVDGARELLDYLFERYEMAIITNGFKEVQHKKIIQSGLAKYFKKLFISEEIGSTKPKREIFEHAIKSMNARKKNSLMIGDSWEADIVGARNFGIDQIYFNPRLISSDLGPDLDAGISNKADANIQGLYAEKSIFPDHSFAKNTSTRMISALTDLYEIL